MKTLMLVAALSLSVATPPEAEVLKTYSTHAAKSTLSISGTSTLHDWEMTAENFNGNLSVDLGVEEMKINTLRLTVPVKSLKSGKSGMDNNAYKALKADDHPNISFQLIKVENCSLSKKECFDVQAVGNLTIAGTTQQIKVPMVAEFIGEEVILKGEKALTMTSYGVEPPSFLMGAMTTGDEIIVRFSIQYI